ncbi:hypothetical protein BGZ63DRAFT_421334 [Mariannaea sp. PMI_226]|nr:hypothetical protein BGZ63DRAFT_421334 [Mariannaea sp. PMI_226]
MDMLKSFTGGGDKQPQDESMNQGQAGRNESGSGFMDKMNSFAGGGTQGEKNEDGLDKAVDFVQEKVLGQDPQNNESAAEQAKDEAISDFIRDKYKDTTGKDFFIKDKDKQYGI